MKDETTKPKTKSHGAIQTCVREFLSQNILPKIIIAVVAVGLLYCSVVLHRIYRFKTEYEIEPLSASQQENLNATLDDAFPERKNILQKLPYELSEVFGKDITKDISVNARSAIIVDVANGCVLYEKNADEIIPPASMTKLAVMFVVFQEIATGRISPTDEVPLPPQSWAKNMPPHSSLMFLGKNQRVTIDELLTGLAVCSGNDAAYALAFYVSGNMENFIERMNLEMQKLGLVHTRFVESSGYSEANKTTAREMAAFCKVYISRYPEALSRYHSRLSFSYPQEHNLAPEDMGKPRAQDWSKGLPENITMGITQQNTNKLLGVLDGADGLKTGYIDESGYNLSLTVARNGTRFLSVTMGGSGRNTAEGNENRARDGKALMEWAFGNFADSTKTKTLHSYIARVTGGKNVYVNLVPAFQMDALTVPFVNGASAFESAAGVKADINIPQFIENGARAGNVYGSVNFWLEDTLLLEVPLVANRDIKKASWLVRMADAPLKKFVFSRK